MKKLIPFVFLFMSAITIAHADKTEELEGKINALADEIEQLKEKGETGKNKVHLFGYGEMHYNGNAGSDGLKNIPANDIMNFHRMVIGMGIDFSDRIKFTSEIDFENGFTAPYIEFAYLDFLISEQFNIRAGSLVTPIGYINETHEPTTFYSVERPYTERLIIPTTWPEGGVGIFGNAMPGLSYKLYAQASLSSADGTKFFQAKNGLRKGRSKAANAIANNIAVVGRLEYTGISGLNVAGSFYKGNSTQNKQGVTAGAVTLWDVDARFRFNGIELRGMYVQYNVGDAGIINAVNVTNGNIATLSDGIGSKGVGKRIEIAYHLGAALFGKSKKTQGHDEEWLHAGALQSWQKPTEMDIIPFVRYENINTQATMPVGSIADPKYDRKVTTMGIAFLPNSDVVAKADIEMWKSGNSLFNYNQFNLGIGYMF